MGRNGVVFVPNTPQQFAAFIDSTRSAFVELLKVVPIKPR
jgi:hypothetical protein